MDNFSLSVFLFLYFSSDRKIYIIFDTFKNCISEDWNLSTLSFRLFVKGLCWVIFIIIIIWIFRDRSWSTYSYTSKQPSFFHLYLFKHLKALLKMLIMYESQSAIIYWEIYFLESKMNSPSEWIESENCSKNQ